MDSSCINVISFIMNIMLQIFYEKDILIFICLNNECGITMIPATSANKPSNKQSMFDDLLGGATFGGKLDGPKTMKDMRKETRAKETDPNKLKVGIVFEDCRCVWFWEGHMFVL